VLRFPDIAYFRDPDVQTHLANILYLWSSVNPGIGYRQGMHELLAMLYIAVDYDSAEEDSVADQTLVELCARTWVAADAWALFVSLMNSADKWYVYTAYFAAHHVSFYHRYEWREPPSATATKSHPSSHVHLPLDNGQVNVPAYVAPVVQSCNRMQSQHLKSVDPQLWKSLQAAGIEPQIYGMYDWSGSLLIQVADFI
jgi:TBC1 domain family protein 5